MKSKNKGLFSGLVLIVIGGAVILIERLTNSGISGLIGKLYCGAKYLQTSGQPGDGMCGFNMDMVVGMASFLLILVGLILLIIGVIKLIVRRMKK